MALLITDACGVAFALDASSPITASNVVQSGWTAELVQGSRLVSAHASLTGSHDTIRAAGLDAAQEGLDLVSIVGSASLAITAADKMQLVWRTDPSGVTLRVVAIRDFVASSTASAGGTPPSNAWHPSFRYFRISQRSTDIVESYRNLYLALESVFTAAFGGPNSGERESDWLRRVLRAIHAATPLTGYADPASTDPPSDIFQDVYAKMRTAVFHAKVGRLNILAGQSAQRDQLATTLERLTRLYLDTVSAHLGVRHISGLMTYSGFDYFMQPKIASRAEAVVDSTSSPTGESDSASLLASEARFAVAHDPSLDRPGTKNWLGSLDVPRAAQSVPTVTRVGLVLDSQLDFELSLPDVVSLGAVSVLETQLGIRLVNATSPRAHWVT